MCLLGLASTQLIWRYSSVSNRLPLPELLIPRSDYKTVSLPQFPKAGNQYFIKFRRQLAVFPIVLSAWHFAEIISRPFKCVYLVYDDPGFFVIHFKVALQLLRDFYRS